MTPTVFVSSPSPARDEVRLLAQHGIEVVTGPGVEEARAHRYAPQEWREHVAAADVLLIAVSMRMAVDSIIAILDGAVPEDVVNPGVLPPWRARFAVPV